MWVASMPNFCVRAAEPVAQIRRRWNPPAAASKSLLSEGRPALAYRMGLL
jgi:hypothetical protein